MIIPAIDLYRNEVVRLHQGSYDSVTTYGTDPAQVAREFAAAGARRIHLVDLDAAQGTGSNGDALARIRDAVSCELEVGGGVRSLERARDLAAWGMDFVVVGTLFARDPDAVGAWVSEIDARIIAGIDARDGVVRVSGWVESAGIAPTDLAARTGDLGIAAVEFTNIARDGAFTGPDIEGTTAVARAARPVPVIASGGVGNMEDVAAAAGAPEIAGIIIGRALYEGKIDLHEAIDRYDDGGAV